LLTGDIVAIGLPLRRTLVPQIL